MTIFEIMDVAGYASTLITFLSLIALSTGVCVSSLRNKIISWLFKIPLKEAVLSTGYLYLTHADEVVLLKWESLPAMPGVRKIPAIRVKMLFMGNSRFRLHGVSAREYADLFEEWESQAKETVQDTIDDVTGILLRLNGDRGIAEFCDALRTFSDEFARYTWLPTQDDKNAEK